VEPAYLDERSTDLVRKLLLSYEAFEGQPYRDLEQALERLSCLEGQDSRVLSGLRRVIEESMELRVEAIVAPRRIREVVFELGRRDLDLEVEEVLVRARDRLGLAGRPVLDELYGDLDEERRVRFPSPPPPPAEVISRYNFRLLEGLFLHAERVRVEVHEQVRAIYRFAKLHGLIVEVQAVFSPPGPPEGADPETGDVRLEVTGPLSLFRHTRKYGHALARFLSACCASARFKLEAELLLGGRKGRLVVTRSDRVLSSHRPPRDFDSKLEKRFYLDFLRLKSHWDISREARIHRIGRGVFIPDFTFRLRACPALAIDLEIVGYWTSDYLERKRALLKSLTGAKVIFCVDEKLCCGDLPGSTRWITFRGRVPAAKVLEALEAELVGDSGPHG